MSENKIQLYSIATPNGQKVSIALEEMELPYEAHRIDLSKGEQFEDWFVKINPNSKIPAIVDPNGPNGDSISIMESGAILLYLAEKSGKFLSADAKLKSETLQWLFFQVGGVGPMFGQFGHFFKYAKDKCDHPYPIERYMNETKRLLTVMEKHLTNRKYLVGDEYSIADMATAPWINALDWGYKAKDTLQLSEFTHVMEWNQRCFERPKTLVGSKVCPV